MRFPTEPWQALINATAQVELDLSSLGGSIRRDEVVALADRAIGSGRYLDAFILTMIWGYGPAGYGPSRTRSVIESEPAENSKGASSVEARLAGASNLARTGSLIDRADKAYRFINRGEGECKNLGPSFFTKWLYVSSAQGAARSAMALPILDEVTRQYVNRNRGTIAPIRVRYTDDYVRYVKVLNHWAGEAEEGTSIVDVEEAIFAVARRSHVSWTDDRSLDTVLR
ncbi:8-oxoguanine DNA glycosylase OGG fold protein [Demequina globuliformis]|uniref:8-oxoguanine DNA glycosylase OGG fold protein n=1 Tax=Demequina globuliformis TaxID=676202 RepID=UPI00128E75CA|nr:hypothetical protein [Demequina globuliformis]